jgi:glycosyltransferase involved in cell wall biosynthesis
MAWLTRLNSQTSSEEVSSNNCFYSEQAPSLNANNQHWISCQLGAREHYAVPRALHRYGALDRLITDAWVPPGNSLATVRRGLRERFHPDLAQARVTSSNLSNITFELTARASGIRGWSLMTSRNKWFQDKVVSLLARYQPLPYNSKPIIFAYSYAAREILRFARTRSWRTVLGQIDPGPLEERIVAKLWEAQPSEQGQWEPAPDGYWENWRDECALADRIVVNSEWSRQALIQEGIPPTKLCLIPLGYEPPAEVRTFERKYPQAYTHQRTLRVLFLGLINLRKGMGPVLDALRLLRNEPMEFEFVGPLQVRVPEDLRRPNIHWRGAVPRTDVAAFYRNADVFLFPTISDGFGLTQLEAQAWKLPIVASPYCGKVIDDGRNGLILKDITADSIAAALRRCVTEPGLLTRFSANAVTREEFGFTKLGQRLLHLFL